VEFEDLIGDMSDISDIKQHVMSIRTKYQQIDIVDRYNDEDFAYLEYINIMAAEAEEQEEQEKEEQEEEQEGEVETQFQEFRRYLNDNPHFEQPERLLYLDGVIQVCLYALFLECLF